MKSLWSSLLILSTIIMLLLLYFLKTEKGHKELKHFLENYLSQETYNKIKVKSLNINHYPYITVKLQINDRAEIILKGEISNYTIDMHYHLKGNSFYFNNFHLDDKIDVEGTLLGKFDHLMVKGEGELFKGKIVYQFINTPKAIKDLVIKTKKTDIQKISEFLKEQSFISGLADIDAKFKSFSSYSKYGRVDVSMKSAIINNLEKYPSQLESTVIFENINYRFQLDIATNSLGRVSLHNGFYYVRKKSILSDYTLYIKSLEPFQKESNHQYHGSIDINGNLTYNTSSNKLLIKGQTQQFKGDINFLYQEDNLYIKLKKVPLEYILKELSYPILFTSNIYGIISVNLKDKSVIANLNLKDTYFISSSLTQSIEDTIGLNLLDEVYDKSHFSVGYQNSELSSLLKIDSGKNYIKLSKTKINILDGKINSKLEININGQSIYGTIYGNVENPQFKVHKGSFIQYKTDRFLSKHLGTKE